MFLDDNMADCYTYPWSYFL